MEMTVRPLDLRFHIHDEEAQPRPSLRQNQDNSDGKRRPHLALKGYHLSSKLREGRVRHLQHRFLQDHQMTLDRKATEKAIHFMTYKLI